MTNFIRRTLSGVIYAAIVAVSLLGPWQLFVLAMGFAIGWSMHEFYRMSLGTDCKLERILAIITASGCFALCFFAGMGFMDKAWICLIFGNSEGERRFCRRARSFYKNSRHSADRRRGRRRYQILLRRGGRRSRTVPYAIRVRRYFGFE